MDEYKLKRRAVRINTKQATRWGFNYYLGAEGELADVSFCGERRLAAVQAQRCQGHATRPRVPAVEAGEIALEQSST